MAVGEVYKIWDMKIVDGYSDGSAAITKGDLVVYDFGNQAFRTVTAGEEPTVKIGVAMNSIDNNDTSTQLRILKQGVVEAPKVSGTAMYEEKYVMASGNQLVPFRANADARKLVGYCEEDSLATKSKCVLVIP